MNWVLVPMVLRLALCVACCAAAACPLLAQKPVIDPDGIRNAASLLPVDPIAPQMLVTIRGRNLAASTETPSTPSLPTTLGAATVTFDGVAAPLLYASPQQINAQVPSALAPLRTVHVVVTTAAGASDPVRVNVGFRAFGIFTQDTSGCGPGAVFNIRAGGALRLNTPLDSFDPARDLGFTVFFTGLGAISDRRDGQPWQFNPAVNAAAAQIGATFLGAPGVQQPQGLNLLYAGPAPGTVGVDQVNAFTYPWLPVPEGCNIPLYLTDFSFTASQLVSVSVHSGGGACVDPPPDRLALVTWRKTTVIDTGSTSATEGVDIEFRQGASLVFPARYYTPHSTLCCARQPDPPACRATLPTLLDAGTLTIGGVSATPTALSPQPADTGVVYRTSFVPGTLAGGAYTVTAAGGPLVGPFAATADIPPPVTVTSSLKPGDTLQLPYRLTWTGGDTRSVVQARLRVGDSFEIAITGGADEHAIDLPASFFQGIFAGPGTIPQGDTEIILEQLPAQPEKQSFDAPGLTEGGQQTWKYVWDFRGLKH